MTPIARATMNGLNFLQKTIHCGVLAMVLLLGSTQAMSVQAAATPQPVPLGADEVGMIQQSVASLKASMTEEGDYQSGSAEDDIRWMDGFLDKRSADWRRQGPNLTVANMLAFWLGDVVIAQTGGKWATLKGQPVILFANGKMAYPHNKILRRVQYGAQDSLMDFYQVSLAVAKGEVVKAPVATP